MVKDRVTDSKRIAQLLASELTGLEVGPLAHVTLVDADTDASASPEGTQAYALTHRETRVGTVFLFPDRVELRLDVETVDPPADAGVRETDEGLVVAIEDGVEVKRAIDVLRAILGDGSQDRT
jgi:hypothetical protein